jgi:hypothetical protein
MHHRRQIKKGDVMEDLTNKPESEMGVPLGGGFGRLISPFEAEELVRRDKARARRAAAEKAAQEKREHRELRHKWIREETAFERMYSANSSSVQAPSLSSQIGCALVCLLITAFFVGCAFFLSSLGA